MKKLSVQAYHRLRDELWKNLGSQGVIVDEFNDDAFKDFDTVLGETLPVDWEWDETQGSDICYGCGTAQPYQTMKDVDEGFAIYCDACLPNQEKIKYIKKVINEWGSFSTAEVEADFSPAINVLGDASVLVEGFYGDHVVACSYVHGTCIEEYNVKYDELDFNVIDDILILVENWEAENIQTEKRISD